MIGIAPLQKILQMLLERASHPGHALDHQTLAEHASAGVTDPHELTRRLRVALAPAVVQQIYGTVRELDVIALEPELERLLTQALISANGPALDPGVAEQSTRGAIDAARRQEDLGQPARLLVPGTRCGRRWRGC